MINYKKIGLSEYEEKEIEKLLEIKDFKETPLRDMWFLIDYIWEKLKCDNQKLNWEKIGKFYSHPVWVLNGLFIERHEESIHQREMIVSYLKKKNVKSIVDYGGGFGTLAKLISENIADSDIAIYEPYPSEFGRKRIEKFPNISFIKKNEKKYECLVQTDVLEHVEDVLLTLKKMRGMVKNRGLILIGNCFQPCIKCHLPLNMHFRYSFDFFANKMGLIKINQLGYIGVYQKKKKEFKLREVRRYLVLSKVYFLAHEGLKKALISLGALEGIKKMINRERKNENSSY